MRRFHDPARYRIVLFDQRGSGRSTPHADLQDNTTWDLVADLEKLRKHLGVSRWQVFGGSWGSTLALAYAQAHPGQVSELVLRGIFMLRRWELEWFYQEGCSRLFPDAWDKYLAPIPEVERHDLMSAYHRRLTSPVESVRLAAARAWSAALYSTTGGQGACPSEPTIAQAVSQSAAISGAAAGGVQHLALDFMGSFRC